ncbi:phosphate ABC transporter permease [Listeria floridensis FSL S10-1187]|uniref:Phosphate transport system permease protein n=1 Tax=Listeria floridensis FSL S10-1187 TaxID=1265817 RepID=A0ABP3AW79_9LIST|nr:phosphate ABC transporter permease subunit PstC [Listeria floridensis]EUJ25576.1 phosphate ABC transporter permease [Listeria floridensis FSL S10-1187]
MEVINEEKLTRVSKKARLESRGKIITFICIAVMVLAAVSILYFVISKGLSTFFVNKVSFIDFISGKDWSPSKQDAAGNPLVGALPMIIGSFAVTLFAACIAAPLAIGAAIFMVEISPRFGKKVLQPVMELLVGIPSVVYGFIGLSVVVPFIREHISGSGFGIAAATVVLTVMILPTVTSLAVDAIKAVPRHYREASLALGATRWQTIWRVVLRSSRAGILTAIVFGMARAFGEALAVQMVIGNSAVIPISLFEPASTLTSILTMGMGNTVMGTLDNNILWSLAMVLLAMSLFFIIIIRFIGRRRKAK